MQLYNIFCSCLKPSTKKTENLRTRRKTSKQQHHQKRGKCNSLTTALQQTIAARETCSGQLQPERPAAAKTGHQRDLQQTIAARETCSGRYNLHKWWRRPAPLPLLSPRSPLPHQPSPSSPSITLPISPLLYPPSLFTPITTTSTPATITPPTLTTTTSYIPPPPPKSTGVIKGGTSPIPATTTCSSQTCHHLQTQRPRPTPPSARA